VECAEVWGERHALKGACGREKAGQTGEPIPKREDLLSPLKLFCPNGSKSEKGRAEEKDAWGGGRWRARTRKSQTGEIARSVTKEGSLDKK